MLTSRDLGQIEQLFIKFEDRIIQRVDIMIDQKITAKIDLAVQQIKEYIDANMEAHEKWLQDHDVRIKKLENNGYQVNDREN